MGLMSKYIEEENERINKENKKYASWN
jgi:hypothetical protein